MSTALKLLKAISVLLFTTLFLTLCIAPINVSHENEIVKRSDSDVNFVTEAALNNSNDDYSLLNGILYDGNIPVPRNITTLNLTNYYFDNFNFIEEFQQLKQLILDGTNFADLNCLKGLQNLQELSLNNCSGISDLSLLSTFPTLRKLNISGTNVSNLSPLSALTNLESLSLLDITAFLDITPLTGLNELKTLQLPQNINHTALKNMPTLTQLTLETSLETDLSPLASLKNLRNLNIFNSSSALDISPVGSLIQLERLIFVGIEEADFTSLQNLEKLESFTLFSNSPFKNIDIFQHMSSLNTLTISAESIENVTALVTFPLPSTLHLTICSNISSREADTLKQTFQNSTISSLNEMH